MKAPLALFALAATAGFADVYLDSRNNSIAVPYGPIAFADEVVSYDNLFGGGPAPTNGKFLDSDQALEWPDYTGGDNGTGAVSLGCGGRIVLKFTNNVLVADGTEKHDLCIFEVGPDIERTFVAISRDGLAWIPVGEVGGATSTIDLDAVPAIAAIPSGEEKRFYYVRLTDDPAADEKRGDTVGADIDAVAALSTLPVLEVDPLAITQTAADRVALTFQTQIGEIYYIQHSADLVDWTMIAPAGFYGDGALYTRTRTINTSRDFFRVVRYE